MELRLPGAVALKLDECALLASEQNTLAYCTFELINVLKSFVE
jgi:hypothetical protein